VLYRIVNDSTHLIIARSVHPAASYCAQTDRQTDRQTCKELCNDISLWNSCSTSIKNLSSCNAQHIQQRNQLYRTL